MRELSLFTGAGGGVYGTMMLGAKVVAYVERDTYCQKIIRRRIADGIFEDAPIFDDVRTFDGNVWRGRVDLITAGFPCQPFSVAGPARGARDERNAWPDTARIVREVRPSLVLLENSPALASSGYLGTVLADLASSGYDAAWSCLSAESCGAPHVRDRVWILAEMANANRERPQTPGVQPGGHQKKIPMPRSDAQTSGPSGTQWWACDPSEGRATGKPRLDRVADGVANRRQRIKAIGNGQVPAVVARVFIELLSRLRGAL